MAQLTQRLLKLQREGRLIKSVIAVFRTQLAYHCMRWRMFNLLYLLEKKDFWLANQINPRQSQEVGINHYQSVASWVNTHDEIREVYPERPLTLHPVQRVGFKCKRADLHSLTHTLKLPAVSLYILRQVEIVGGSEMIFTPEGAVLYDELAQGDVNRYGGKAYSIVPHSYFSPYLPAATKELLLCLYYRPAQPISISRAISLLKDHSQNYYHWLLECLPRAILTLRQTDWAEDAPLLIDADLPAQFIESLRVLSPTRKHISIPQGLRQPVQELYFPSVLSPTHDYYGTSPRAADFLIAPEAVALLRESFLHHAPSGTSEQTQQFIYVARSGSTHRLIMNESEVISALEEMGFTIVFPGRLSFVEQIALFASAKIIVGPTGAAMANIVFANSRCKIAVLAPVTLNANYYLFAQIAQYLDQQIVYIGGKPSATSDLHSHYHIDVHVLQMLIKEYIRDSRE